MQENLEVTILVHFNVLRIETFHLFWNRKLLHVSEIKIVFQMTLSNKFENHYSVSPHQPVFCLVNYLTENFTSDILHLANQSNEGMNQKDSFHNTVALI